MRGLRAEELRLDRRSSPSRPAPRTCSRSATTAAAACSSAPRTIADTHAPARARRDDLAAILYTSGTTGRSKGAMLTHGNLLSNARDAEDATGAGEPRGGDVLIHALPIFHVHGLFVASHGALLAGTQDALARPLRRRRAVVALLPDATVFMGVPTLYVRLLAEPALDARGLPQHAPLHQRLGAAAGRDLRRLARAHRPHHPRALRHERDGDADLQPVPRAGRRAPRRHRRLPAARRRAARPRRPGPAAAGAARSAASRCAARTSSPATGACPRRPREEFTADGWFKTGDVGRIDARRLRRRSSAAART